MLQGGLPVVPLSDPLSLFQPLCFFLGPSVSLPFSFCVLPSLPLPTSFQPVFLSSFFLEGGGGGGGGGGAGGGEGGGKGG